MNESVPEQKPQSLVPPMQTAQQVPNQSNMPQNTQSNKKYVVIVVVLLFILFLGGGVSYMISRYLTLRKIANLPVPEQETIQAKPQQDTDSSTASGSATFTIVDKKENVKGITSKTLFFESDKNLDGYMTSESAGSTKTDIRVGFDDTSVTRGFLTFDLLDLPPGIDISKATLRMFLVKTKGNPTNIGGKLLLDHLTYGNSLENDDYALPALLGSAQTFPTKLKSDWYEIDVTDLVKDDAANGRVRSQYRLHFENEVVDADSNGDYVYFEAQDNSLGTDKTPELVVTYN